MPALRFRKCHGVPTTALQLRRACVRSAFGSLRRGSPATRGRNMFLFPLVRDGRICARGGYSGARRAGTRGLILLVRVALEPRSFGAIRAFHVRRNGASVPRARTAGAVDVIVISWPLGDGRRTLGEPRSRGRRLRDGVLRSRCARGVGPRPIREDDDLRLTRVRSFDGTGKAGRDLQSDVDRRRRRAHANRSNVASANPTTTTDDREQTSRISTVIGPPSYSKRRPLAVVVGPRARRLGARVSMRAPRLGR